MNKGELIDAVTPRVSITKKEADVVLSATVDINMEAVSAGEKVTLVRFGTFERRKRQSRKGRNPRASQSIQIPATTLAAFSAGKLFKERIAPKVETKRTATPAKRKK